MGAEAAADLDGRRGLLYGEKRLCQVDILGFEPAPGEAGAAEPNPSGAASATLAALVRGRLDHSEISGWRIVGVAVRGEDLNGWRDLLLSELVAGDVVIESVAVPHGSPSPDPGRPPGAAPARRPRVFVHRGDRLEPLRRGRVSGLGDAQRPRRG